jgi:DNA-binding HxlR family transcriptional regulator
MSKYGQYCPTTRAVEVLGDRWTLLIIRNLLFGSQSFSNLERGLPGISKALLSKRLKQLRAAGVVQTRDDRIKTGYQLTEAGRALQPVIDSLTRWGAAWAFGEPDPTELNPVLLMWWMRDRVHLDRLPDQRVVVEFHFGETRPNRCWLLLSPQDVSVCLTHPGYEVDILVEADLAIFYQVWLGRLPITEAILQEQIRLLGEPSLTHAFPTWFMLSPTAGAVREIARTARPRMPSNP